MATGEPTKSYATFCAAGHGRYSWTGPAYPVPPCPQCAAEKKTRKWDVAAAVEMALEIQRLAEDLPDEGEDFGLSVGEKAADIAANIEQHGRVTDGQWAALENMLSGLSRWFHD
jgi:hypothetical protein